MNKSQFSNLISYLMAGLILGHFSTTRDYIMRCRIPEFFTWFSSFFFFSFFFKNQACPGLCLYLSPWPPMINSNHPHPLNDNFTFSLSSAIDAKVCRSPWRTYRMQWGWVNHHGLASGNQNSLQVHQASSQKSRPPVNAWEYSNIFEVRKIPTLNKKLGHCFPYFSLRYS